MNNQEIVSEIRDKGLYVFPNVFSATKCKAFIDASNKVINKFIEEDFFLLHKDSQHIVSPFQHDELFLDLIYQPKIDEVMKELLDPDYVLISSNISNRQIRENIKTGYKNPLGDNWHNDSRVVGGQRLDKGFSYLAIIMLDDFTVNNGATQYIPGSHVRRGIPERYGDYEFKYLEGKAGSLVIMDSGTWHKRGCSSMNSRWSVFNLFGPWFMKPYFRFPELMGEEFGKRTSKEIRRLLHYNSTPPLNERERFSTLVRE